MAVMHYQWILQEESNTIDLLSVQIDKYEMAVCTISSKYLKNGGWDVGGVGWPKHCSKKGNLQWIKRDWEQHSSLPHNIIMDNFFDV